MTTIYETRSGKIDFYPGSFSDASRFQNEDRIIKGIELEPGIDGEFKFVIRTFYGFDSIREENDFEKLPQVKAQISIIESNF